MAASPPIPAGSFWHACRADARAILRETPTPLLLSDLADHRADLAQPVPPLWWLDAVIQAGRIRAVLRERGTETETRALPKGTSLRLPRCVEG